MPGRRSAHACREENFLGNPERNPVAALSWLLRLGDGGSGLSSIVVTADPKTVKAWAALARTRAASSAASMPDRPTASGVRVINTPGQRGGDQPGAALVDFSAAGLLPGLVHHGHGVQDGHGDSARSPRPSAAGQRLASHRPATPPPEAAGTVATPPAVIHHRDDPARGNIRAPRAGGICSGTELIAGGEETWPGNASGCRWYRLLSRTSKA